MLDAYVAREDPSYAWEVRREGEIDETGYVELVLTSQMWREVAWRHQLYVLWPTTMEENARHALLFLHGGSWRPAMEDPELAPPLPREAAFLAAVAEALGTPLAVLRQVPFQPLFEGLTEDRLISYTFERFLDTGDPDWPLLLPMVKSVVRAMDAIQELGLNTRGLALEGFTVTGASKRGWTTWLAAAADDRVRAIAPMAIDMLDLQTQLDHQRATWGDYSPQLHDYTERGLHERLEADVGQALLSIVDPFRYRDRLTQPKLIVVGTNDVYWPLDALNLYWDELPEPRRALYLPNTGHRADDFVRVVGGLVGLHGHLVAGRPLPEPTWRFEEGPLRLRLRVSSDLEPQSVRGWSAAAPTRDFRDARWSSAACRPEGGEAVCEIDLPEKGFGALFAELVYTGDGEQTLFLSTGVRIASRSPPTNLSCRGEPATPGPAHPR